MIQPVLRTSAVVYSELYRNTIIMSKHQIDPYLYIHVDPKLTRWSELFQVDEVIDSDSHVVVGAFEQDSTSWIKAETALLNTNPGHHLYKLSFLNLENNSVFSLYVAYIIQDSSVDKPYIYMPKDREVNDSTDSELEERLVALRKEIAHDAAEELMM